MTVAEMKEEDQEIKESMTNFDDGVR